ncbi:MAG: hypothetical protein IJI12_04445 [Atopobiaceae bacterium]|nr:hypothetical protein [Atopobiaceae bacterium]
MPQDRYIRVFTLPECQYSAGLPFIVEAGALLVDTKTDGVVAQLKMASHADQNVKAVKVTIQPRDTRGEILGDEIIHQYLDLDMARGISFGQKTPIHLPDSSTRAFSISGVEVVYSDNSVASSEETWKPLPSQKALSETISDQETLRQYRIDFGDGCQYRLQELDGIWRCVCGSVNRDNEETCHSCGQSIEALRSIDPSAIEEHKATRLEAERIERENQAEHERLKRIEEGKKASETKRAKMILAAIASLMVLAFGIYSFIHSNRTPGKADFGPDTIFDVSALEALSADEVERYTKASTLDFQEETSQRKDGYRVYGFSLGGKLDKALHLRSGQKFGLTDDENNDFTCIMWYTTKEYGLTGTPSESERKEAATRIISDISPYLGLGDLEYLYVGKGPDGATDWALFWDKGKNSVHNYVCIKFYTDGAAILVGNRT